jgi:hypothetical protein
MSYSYDEGSQEVQQGGNQVGWALTAAFATAVIALMTAVLGGDAPMTPTFSSSILAPPAEVSWWTKGITRDASSVAWWSGAVPITQTNDLGVADVITASGNFTLTEHWETSVLSLTGWISETGAVTYSTTGGVLTWTVSGPVSGTTLVKTWRVIAAGWSTTTITETLVSASGSQSMTITLDEQEPPTPTPTPTLTPSPTVTPTDTPTPQPTYTPNYTPQPWQETPYPTMTPCSGFGCDPDGSLTYDIYLPLVMNNY